MKWHWIRHQKIKAPNPGFNSSSLWALERVSVWPGAQFSISRERRSIRMGILQGCVHRKAHSWSATWALEHVRLGCLAWWGPRCFIPGIVLHLWKLVECRGPGESVRVRSTEPCGRDRGGGQIPKRERKKSDVRGAEPNANSCPGHPSGLDGEQWALQQGRPRSFQEQEPWQCPGPSPLLGARGP